jgi:hypothetical protein
MLAKMVSSCQPVLPSIFTSDQYKPSIRYKEPRRGKGEPHTSGSGATQPLAPPDPKDMELDEEPAVEPNTLVD